MREFVLPHLLKAAEGGEGAEDQHILLVAHGIWLSEMMFAFKRAEQPGARFIKTSGYLNTAWSRLEVELVEEGEGDSKKGEEQEETGELEQPMPHEAIVTPAAPSEAAPSHVDAAAEHDAPLSDEIAALRPTLPNVPTPRHCDLPPPHPSSSTHDDASVEPTFPIPRLRLKVLATNQAEHLEGLVRTKGGVGSSAHDEKQRSLKEFFAGGGSAAEAPSEEGGKL